MVGVLRKIGSFCLVFYSFHLFSYEIRLEKEFFSVGDFTRLIIEGSLGNKTVTLDAHENLRVIGPSHSSQTAIKVINGKMTKESYESVQYQIMGTQRGEYSLKVKIDNKIAKEFNLKIGEAKKSQDIFIKAVVNEEEIYPGSEVQVDYYLYIHEGIALKYKGMSSDTVLPEHETLNIQWSGAQQKQKIETVIENGLRYRRILLLSGKVTTYSEGEFEIQPFIGTAIFADQNEERVFFDLFSINNDKALRLVSNTLKIKTVNLPVLQPKNFLGFMANSLEEASFSIDHQFLKKDTEGFLKFKIVSSRYLRSFNKDLFLDTIFQDLDWKNKDLIVFSPEEKTEKKDQKTEKEYTWTIVPKRSFTLEEKEHEFSYFNLKNKTYEQFLVKVPKIESVILSQDLEVKKDEEIKNSLEEEYVKTDWKNNILWKYFYYVNLFIFYFLFLWIFIKKTFLREKKEWEVLYEKMDKNLNYENFFLLLMYLSKKMGTKDLLKALQELKFKDYFIDLYQKLNQDKFKDHEQLMLKKNKKALKELKKLLKKHG